MISDRVIAAYFPEENVNPSPVGFALHCGINPRELKRVAGEEILVELALYRIIAIAEGALYDKVHGPLNLISRVELFLPSAEDEIVEAADMFVQPKEA